MEHVIDPRRHAWKATARVLVLYNPKGQWRYAVYNDKGVLDGMLDASAEAAPEEAQAQLLAEVEEITEQRYVARWTQNRPHWWTADLIVTL
ncbi:hypothetical protein [Dactylosporangium sp. NPDC006015]|uniref:hypothetical protein n=1 Tax=Dactylosporangium sp. NPDC006015 TaxID=3154576 RepID=UPI0033BA6A02